MSLNLLQAVSRALEPPTVLTLARSSCAGLCPAFVTICSYSPLSFEDALDWGGKEDSACPLGSTRNMPNHWIGSSFHDLSEQGLSRKAGLTTHPQESVVLTLWRSLLALVLTKLHFSLTGGYGDLCNTVDAQAALSKAL